GKWAAAARTKALGRRENQNSRAITQQRRANSPERGQHQFAGLSGGNWLGAGWNHDLRNVTGLDHMQDPGPSRTLKRDRASFSHAVMIANLRARPGRLQTGARAENAAARLAGHDEFLHRRRGEIDSLADSDLGQMQTVSGRAAQRRGTVVQDRAQTRQTAHPPAGQTAAPQPAGRFKRQPEP